MNEKKPVIVVDNSKMDETLSELDSLALAISPSQELEQKVDVVNEIESLAVLTKQQLTLKREKVQLEVENKKLDTANKTIDSIEKIINAVSSAEVLEKVTKSIKTPMDMKMMAEAAERLTNTLKGLMNSNIADEMGNKKKQKINFMFKSSGTVQGAIQIDNSNDD
jgi:hypothetical protein